MNETATIIPLSAVEPAMVETLLDRVFGDDRHARTAYRIRAGMAPLEAMSFAVLDEAELLVGTIQCFPVALHDREGRPVPLVMVGPVAIVEERRGEGFGFSGRR